MDLIDLPGHIHKFNYDSTAKGLCECGALVQKLFDENGKIKERRVLHQGNSNFLNNRNVPTDPPPNIQTAPPKTPENITENITEIKTPLDEKPAAALPLVSKPQGGRKLQNWYEDNKEQIIQSYLTVNLKTFYDLWGIASNTWRKLKLKWHIKNRVPRRASNSALNKAPESKSSPSLPSKYSANNAPSLPKLPEFNNSWPLEIQIKWLEVYKILSVLK